MYKVSDIAGMIDHSLLHPTLTDQELEDGCILAKKYGVATVCIKPYAVKQAVDWLSDSVVMVGTVIGFPHGNSAIAIKIREAEKACKDGAQEIDMVVNIGKVLSEDWTYVEEEVRFILNMCHGRDAVLKVIFENNFLPEDRFKIKLCEICNELHVDFVKTSTGYGFVKSNDGTFGYAGATDHDLKLMRRYCNPEVQVKAAGGIRTLDDVLRVRDLGVTRIGASATEAILIEAIRRFGDHREQRQD
jgi:deoxyribose-phosphate aldolase